MKRKKRLVAVCLTLILFICSSISSVASDSTVIKVTDTLVLQMAERQEIVHLIHFSPAQ